MTSHDFDMARFLVGSNIEEVYVQGKAWGPEAAGAKDLDTQVRARQQPCRLLISLATGPSTV
jgi:predicted dehydrogenase